MRRRPQQLHEQSSTSFFTHKNLTVNKVSLKRIRPTVLISQHTQKTTTCNSIHGGNYNNKQSIKKLLVAARSRNHHSENYISMTYEDIRVPLQPKPQNFIANLLCSLKPSMQELGCSCGNGNKCPWMDHWLALSMKALPYEVQNLYPIPKSTQDQITKDITRTQPNSKAFQGEQYQSALYECLMAYARIDPQVGYVQGMNIVCSILLYHNLNIYDCVQVLRFLMISCQFRKAYLSDFEFAHKLSASLIHTLKYRCSDLHRHLIEKHCVNLGIFVIGWILPMLGNIIPLPHMHMVLNIFIQRGWQGLLKIMISLLLYLRPTILSIYDQTQLMQLLSVHGLKTQIIPWDEIIVSSTNVKTGSYLSM